MTFVGYYINLNRDSGRRQVMETTASRLSLPLQRIPAIDCRSLGPHWPAGFQPHRYRHERWTLRSFEIAVFESHRKAWSQFLASEHRLGLILEDDLCFSREFPKVLGSLSRHPDRFDIVRLCHSIQSRRFGPAITGTPGLVLRAIHENIADAGGYLLTRPAAESLLHQSRQYCSHLDDFLFSPDRGLRIMQLFPPACGQFIHKPDATPIAAAINLSNRLPLVETAPKGPLGFRLFKESRRLVKRFCWRVRSGLSGGSRVDMTTFLRTFDPLVTLPSET
jgi:GR25 family glycosyltransferase involved in LPS biosynthesis